MHCPVCNTRCEEGLEGDLELSTCLVCRHIWQTRPVVSVVYNAKYIHDRYDSYDTTEVMSNLRLGFVKAFARGGRLLDIGYGNGSFLRRAAKAGFDVFGSDIHGVDYGVKEVPLVEAANGSWDVVTLFDSFEHFPDLTLPRAVAARARVVIISIPCRPDSFPARKDWKHYRPGEHLHYFSRYSLELAFLRDHTVACRSDLEDSIRGKLPGGEQNILTVAFIPSA